MTKSHPSSPRRSAAPLPIQAQPARITPSPASNFLPTNLEDPDVLKALGAIQFEANALPFKVTSLAGVSKKDLGQIGMDLVIDCQADYGLGQAPVDMKILCLERDGHWHCMALPE